jgi:serine/threonine-protein kinase
MAFSPDGNQLAYVAGRGGGQQLYLRSLDSLEAKPLAGTEGAFGPFFSPDGQWIGFFAEGNLKKVSVTGGAPVTLASSSRTNSRGGTWGSDGRIIFAPGATTGLSRVSASRDTPEVLTTLDTKKGEGSHRFPQLLPGGKAVLFTIGTGGSWDAAQIVAQRLDSGERTVLIQGGSDGRYLPSGHLVYVRAATLMAVPFDPERLEVKGSPVPLIEGVLQGTENSGAMHASVSSSGWLVYAAGGNRLERTVVWVDRKGAEQPLAAPPRPYVAPRLSPDGQLVLEGIDQGNKTDIWLYTIARGTLTRLTFEATNNNPVWAPDGKRIAFSSSKAGAVNLFWKLADGSGPEERLTSSENTQNSTSWSPDGQFIAFTEIDRKSRGDVWVLPLQGDRKPIPVARTSFGESAAAFSPDGLRLAYVSDESGRQEVYVQLFPGLGGKLQISTDGGTEPVWSRDGKELFYRNGDAMMAVPIAMRPTFTPGKPGTLFEKPYRRSGATPNYDVSPDGQRFLMVKDSEQATAVTQITVVLNWFEELKRKVPGKQ